MRDSSLQHELDDLFRRAESLREEGRYAESVGALLAAVGLIDRYSDDPPHYPAEPMGARPVVG
jgi:hypothetical protein